MACMSDFVEYKRTNRVAKPTAPTLRPGIMQNGAAMKYMATGDMLYSKVQSRRMDDATALYYLANALSQGDLEYSATHPAPAFRSFTCHNFGYSTTCY